MSPTCADFKRSVIRAVAAIGCGVRVPGGTEALAVGAGSGAARVAEDGDGATAAGWQAKRAIATSGTKKRADAYIATVKYVACE